MHITHSTEYLIILFFFFNDTAPTEIYTLSLHDALPIGALETGEQKAFAFASGKRMRGLLYSDSGADRKSTRLNSSHAWMSYAGFCLKKKRRIAQSTFRQMPHMMILPADESHMLT